MTLFDKASQVKDRLAEIQADLQDKEIDLKKYYELPDEDSVDYHDRWFDQLPFAYHVGKHDYYDEGRVVKLNKGGNAIVEFRDEEVWDWECEIQELPVSTILQIAECFDK